MRKTIAAATIATGLVLAPATAIAQTPATETTQTTNTEEQESDNTGLWGLLGLLGLLGLAGLKRRDQHTPTENVRRDTTTGGPDAHPGNPGGAAGNPRV